MSHSDARRQMYDNKQLDTELVREMSAGGSCHSIVHIVEETVIRTITFMERSLKRVFMRVTIYINIIL